MQVSKISAILVMMVLAVWVPRARSQDTSEPQTGSSTSAQSAEGTASEESATPQTQPDTNPLGGAFMYTVGSVVEAHSYLQPELGLGEEAFTNAGYLPGSPNKFQSVTTALGGLTLDLYGKRNSLTAQYLGGGTIVNSNTALDSQFHEVSLVDSFRFDRGRIILGDVFSYTPEAGFGLGNIGVLGGFSSGAYNGLGLSSGLGAINPMFAPNESILTTGYGAYSNTTLVEGEYPLSARTSITGLGTYGTLQFGGGTSFINGNNADGMVGLNHTLTRRDAIGVAYIYGTFHYVGLRTSFQSQAAYFTYGRKITGRLGLQVYGGPEFVTYTAARGQTATGTYVSGSANLSYALKASSVGLYVGRYSSGGSGVLPGAETTTAALNYERHLGRAWQANMYGGYSRNSGFALSPTSATITIPANTRSSHYNYWYGDLTFNRSLGRHLNLFIGYEYQRSSTPSNVIAPSLTNQIAGVGITYTPRPLEL